MEEIRFRAWESDWQGKSPKMNYEPHLLSAKGDLNGYGHWGGLKQDVWIDDILEQYTGLKDKDGVEIYEGDILSKTEGSENRIVKWGVGQWIIDGKTRHDQPLWTWERSCEVIGNIHEDKK